MNDSLLENHLKSLQMAIKTWAEQHDLWDSSIFRSWIECFDTEPIQDPVITLIRCDSAMARFLANHCYDDDDRNLHEEFKELLQKFDCYYCLYDEDIAEIIIYRNNELQTEYRNYFEWQWICSLVKPDFSDLYEEIYEWFHKNPDDLYHIDPRQFEVLLDGVFRNNGFRTQLGSGRADGGVDIRLYSNDVIGEVVTLVQAKRYAPSNPIELQAVQALSAVVEDERANQGLFITTSRYLPCAKNFAGRQNTRLKLATSEDVSLWSSYAAEHIIRDKSKLIQSTHLEKLLDEKGVSSSLEGKIVYARWGATMLINSFAIVLRESKGAVLLMKLPTIVVSGDSLRGCEVPDIGIAAFKNLNAEKVFRAKKIERDSGEVALRGDMKLYVVWDDTPQPFDYFD